MHEAWDGRLALTGLHVARGQAVEREREDVAGEDREQVRHLVGAGAPLGKQRRLGTARGHVANDIVTELAGLLWVAFVRVVVQRTAQIDELRKASFRTNIRLSVTRGCAAPVASLSAAGWDPTVGLAVVDVQHVVTDAVTLDNVVDLDRVDAIELEHPLATLRVAIGHEQYTVERLQMTVGLTAVIEIGVEVGQ